MISNNLWNVLGVITIILLVVFWQRRNAVWGGFTIGVIVGFIISIISLFKNNGFSLIIIGKGAIVGVLLGFVAELLGKISDRMKSKR